jgi:hypothetical protein
MADVKSWEGHETVMIDAKAAAAAVAERNIDLLDASPRKLAVSLFAAGIEVVIFCEAVEHIAEDEALSVLETVVGVIDTCVDVVTVVVVELKQNIASEESVVCTVV